MTGDENSLETLVQYPACFNAIKAYILRGAKNKKYENKMDELLLAVFLESFSLIFVQ